MLFLIRIWPIAAVGRASKEETTQLGTSHLVSLRVFVFLVIFVFSFVFFFAFCLYLIYIFFMLSNFIFPFTIYSKEYSKDGPVISPFFPFKTPLAYFISRIFFCTTMFLSHNRLVNFSD